MRRRTLAPILIGLTWLALTAIPVEAQAPRMQVRVRDLRGAGVPGVVIMLDDAAGRTALARQATDAQGMATFADLPTTTVCLRLGGTLADGTPIRLSESSFADRDALLVRTDVGSPLVALVLDAAGQVVIDPAALEPEGGSGVTPTPGTPGRRPATMAVAPDQTPRSSRTLPLWALVVVGLVLTAVGYRATCEWRHP